MLKPGHLKATLQAGLWPKGVAGGIGQVPSGAVGVSGLPNTRSGPALALLASIVWW